MFSNSVLTSAPGSMMPATSRMICWRYNSSLRCCTGFSTMAALDTMTEHTRLRPIATSSVLEMLSRSNSFLSDIAFQPPIYVGLHYEVVNYRCEYIGEQDGEHDALRERRIDDAYQPGHEADQQPVYPFARVGLGSADGIRRHERGAERETTQHHVPLPRHGHHRVAAVRVA